MPAQYDVCVVGSGPGGGIAAYALAKAGLRVVLLEAGPKLRAGIDYGKHGMPWEVTEDLATGAYNRNSASGLREQNHFTPVGDRPDHGWLKAVGGRSLCWASRHALRFGPKDFREWPIPYEEVAPYYSRAERFMGVYGNKDGLWNMPDGEYQKPIGMRCAEHILGRGVARLKAKGAKMEFVEQRKAMATVGNSTAKALCHFCGKCNGCCIDAKYTSANTPIPLALQTGNLTLLTDAMMTRIVTDTARRRVTGVEYTNGAGAVERVDCRALVLACNSIETPRQLLINKLANSSGQVGRNLTSHFVTSPLLRRLLSRSTAQPRHDPVPQRRERGQLPEPADGPLLGQAESEFPGNLSGPMRRGLAAIRTAGPPRKRLRPRFQA